MLPRLLSIVNSLAEDNTSIIQLTATEWLCSAFSLAYLTLKVQATGNTIIIDSNAI